MSKDSRAEAAIARAVCELRGIDWDDYATNAVRQIVAGAAQSFVGAVDLGHDADRLARLSRQLRENQEQLGR